MLETMLIILAVYVTLDLFAWACQSARPLRQRP
jgi:hypothetical protein